MTNPARSALWARCRLCLEVWKFCDLPMDMGKVAKLLGRVRCPACGAKAKDITTANEADIQAAEQRARGSATAAGPHEPSLSRDVDLG